MSEFRQLVLQEVYDTYRTGKLPTTSNEVCKGIGNLTLYYRLNLTKDSPLKTVVDIPTFVNNVVIGLKQDAAQSTTRPYQGIMQVIDGPSRFGLCQETSEKVNFATDFPCRAGERWPYLYTGGIYYLQNNFPGSARNPRNFADNLNGDILFHEGATCTEFLDLTAWNEPFGKHKFSKAKNYDYPETDVWYKYKNSNTYISYVQNKTYIERNHRTHIVEEELKCEIDISAYLTDTAATGSMSFPDTRAGTYTITNPEVVRIVHFGDIAVLQVMTEKRTYLEQADLDTDHQFYAMYGFAVGEGTVALNSICVFDLLVINTVTEAVNHLSCVNHATWFGYSPVTIAGGYIDIQMDKETGRVLFVKSAASASSGSVSVSYYGVTCIRTLDYSNILDDDDNPKHVPDYTTSVSASTKQAAYALYLADINLSTLGFANITTLFSQSATESTIQGVSVSGGCRSLTFTQQPESFDIYLRRHLVGYKYVNKDWSYSPVNGDPTRIENFQRSLVSIGVMEYVDINDNEIWVGLTTETGVFDSISQEVGEPDEYAVGHITKAMTYTTTQPMALSYGIRSHWPQFEAVNGEPDYWENAETEYGRDDFPTTGFTTWRFETRFAQCLFGMSSNTPKVTVEFAGLNHAVTSPSVQGVHDKIRNDPGTFMVFTVGNEGPLVLITGTVVKTVGRFLSDSEDDFDHNGGHVLTMSAWAFSDVGAFLNKFRDRENRPQNMLYLAKQPKFPQGTSHWCERWNSQSQVAPSVWQFRHGWGRYSAVQVLDSSAYYSFVRHRYKEDMNLWDNYVVRSDRMRSAAVIHFSGSENYLESINPVYGTEYVCFWGGGEQWNEDTTTDIALRHSCVISKSLLKLESQLSINALYTP